MKDYILTDRLILRRFKESDYDDLYMFLYELKDDIFECYKDITYENTKKYLSERMTDEYYAIELRKNHKVIGNISFINRSYNSKEIGFIVSKEYQWNGFASEAINTIKEEAFLNGIHRIYSECDPLNLASWKTLEKAGFKKEAHLLKNIYFHFDEHNMPIWKDTYIYAILNENEI